MFIFLQRLISFLSANNAKSLFRQKHQVLLDVWAMETSEYESFVQWLPREMMEDVIALVKIR